MGQCWGGRTFETQNQLEAHQAKCYMVSCMDFRLIDDIVMFMDEHGYNNNYDQFILAGSSLGFTQTKFPHWGQSLMDHMGIGQDLHSFREIIFIDHLDCGAFKKFYPNIKDKEDEIKYHVKHMQMARDHLATKFPKFAFRGFLMDLDGTARELNIDQSTNLYHEHGTNAADNFLAGISKSIDSDAPIVSHPHQPGHHGHHVARHADGTPIHRH